MNVRRILADKGGYVEAVSPGDTLGEAVRRLAAKRIGALLVRDAAGAIRGILSERDIVRALVGGATALQEPVDRHMTRDVVTCSPDLSVADVMELMTQGRFRHLPVIEDGGLIGLISIGDVVKSRVAEIESEKSAIIAYIATA